MSRGGRGWKDAREAGRENAGVVGYNGFTALDAYVWKRFGARGAWIVSGAAFALLVVIAGWAFTG
jgi:hypothetical protein